MLTGISKDSFVKEDDAEHEFGLIKELKPLLAEHGIGTKKLLDALKAARLSLDDSNSDRSPQDTRATILRLVFGNLFDDGGSLWIHLKTDSGNLIPSEILIEAYLMWKKALRMAERYGVDPAAAADAMAKATYATADQVVKAELNEREKAIVDIRKYLFVSYMHAIHASAIKQGIHNTDCVDLADWIGTRDLSDRGAFVEFLDCGILFQEFLEILEPRAKKFAYFRYYVGYSWREAVDGSGLSIFFAQKILSNAIRYALSMCMRELHDSGYKQHSLNARRMQH
jgi:hypothetical protein